MKLIASDFDGTMLRPDSTLSEYSKEVICKIALSGDFIATAPFHGVRPHISFKLRENSKSISYVPRLD